MSFYNYKSSKGWDIVSVDKAIKNAVASKKMAVRRISQAHGAIFSVGPEEPTSTQKQELYGLKTAFLNCVGERPVIFLKFLKKVLKSE